MDWEARRDGIAFARHSLHVAPTCRITAGPGGNLGAFIAWDASTGKRGVGDQGNASGLERRARDCGRCRLLWHARWLAQGRGRHAPASRCGRFKVGSGVVGALITYRGPDGKQYVAVYAGIGGDWFADRGRRSL